MKKVLLGILVVGVLILLAGFLTPLILRSEKKTGLAEAMHNMKQLYLHLIDYEQKVGNFPKDLKDLVTEGHIDTETFGKLNQAETSSGNKPFGYISGYKTTDDPNTIILYLPEPIDGKRVFLRIDGSVKQYLEEDFKALLMQQEE